MITRVFAYGEILQAVHFRFGPLTKKRRSGGGLEREQVREGRTTMGRQEKSKVVAVRV